VSPWLTKVLFLIDFKQKQLFRTLTLGVRALVQNENGEILLVKHHYWPGWHFPGGRVGAFEDPKNSIEREVKEETGVIVSETKLAGVYTNFGHKRNDHVLFFIAKHHTGSVAPCNIEIAEACYFSKENLPSDTARSVLKRLAGEEGEW